jgi:formylglycine-generating enzyme required for sulfatase activity/tetratricopeptide (TPR) repeat protein
MRPFFFLMTAVSVAFSCLAGSASAQGPAVPTLEWWWLSSCSTYEPFHNATGFEKDQFEMAEAQLAASRKETPLRLAHWSSTVAVLNFKWERLDRAEEMLKNALAVTPASANGTATQYAAERLLQITNLLEIYRLQRRTKEARPLYEMVKGLLGDQPTQRLAETLDTLPTSPERKEGINSSVSICIGRAALDFEEFETAHVFGNNAVNRREASLASNMRYVKGSGHPNLNTALVLAARANQALGKYAEAGRLLARFDETIPPRPSENAERWLLQFEIGVMQRPPGHAGSSEALRSLINNARVAIGWGSELRQKEAKNHPLDPLIGYASGLVSYYYSQHPADWNDAKERFTSVIDRLKHKVGSDGTERCFDGRNDFRRSVNGWLRAAFRLYGKAPPGSNARVFLEDGFTALQSLDVSQASLAIAKFTARQRLKDNKLDREFREYQDLLEACGRLEAASLQMGDFAPKPELTELKRRLKDAKQRITRRVPEAFVDESGPITITELQHLLADDEALIVFEPLERWYHDDSTSYRWIVTKSDVTWTDVRIGPQALASEVAALRCGLDQTAWSSPSDSAADTPTDKGSKSQQRRTAEFCIKSLGTQKGERDRSILPFDAARSHELYRRLLGGAEAQIQGKHLIVVPSGALTTLPFQVLVTRRPTSPELKDASWLIRDHALTVLPSVASLASMRRAGSKSAAPKPMVGFANPLLDGDQTDGQFGAWFKQEAQRARGQNECAKTSEQRTATARSVSRSVIIDRPRPARLADLAQLRRQAPLPETADEVCDVARSVGADVTDMRIGKAATEAEVKKLSIGGALAQYRIVHFATHGTLAGQIDGTTEPGLILTPPAVASPEDDGYLSASEIAGLQLDADLVILSACNTAAGAEWGEAAEALSGLARAFFYAGARALLVSHWEVDSDAAVKLVTHAVAELSKDKAIGRAEALRRAMLNAIADTTRPAHLTPAWHPAVWAAFVLVGEPGIKGSKDDDLVTRVPPGSGKSFRDCPDCPEMVVVPGGTFVMGSPEAEVGRRPDEAVRELELSGPFAVSKFEITLGDWKACVHARRCTRQPKLFGPKDELPIQNISWNEVVAEFLPWLSERAGAPYRLLTEAEWEHSARAGTKTVYSWGNSITKDKANYSSAEASDGEAPVMQAQPVGTFKPNPWGLHNVHGNVAELVIDCYTDRGQSVREGRSDLRKKCDRRVIRGGHYFSKPADLRAARRTSVGQSWVGTDEFGAGVGFRVARDLGLRQ